ncbi:MAG: class I SAM-dependent methyltransferase [Planctomycetia bacterium]|nr:class I SAM-dependent methyltransferase [Planctomycetia bacterium]
MTAADGYVTDVSYTPGFYPNMAPVAMRYVAALNRVVPPQTANGFRYLELGCGLGRSLTTLAAANPKGEFVGIDVNPNHTASIQKDITAGKLSNARVITADFGHLPKDLGKFDFIALHGVLSWVVPTVRDAIISIAKKHLASGGLLLVSYNSMPGWAALQPIRGILRQYALLRQGDSAQRMRDALAYLVFIRDKQAKYFEDNPRAATYVDGLLKQDVNYLVHEYLNEHWTSFYFSEVAGMFGTAGLAFVGSLPVFTNFWDLCVRPDFQELFRTTTNRLVTESHKDFCANTAFRWDIYSNGPRMMPEVADRLREADDLFFHVTAANVTLPYQSNLGVVTSTVQGPLYQSLLGLLADKSLRLSEILAANELKGTPPADLARAVDAGVAMGLFDVTAGPLGSRPATSTASLEGTVSLTNPFNKAILHLDSLGGRALALASSSTGTGHTLGDFDAAILHELVERGRDGLTSRIETRLLGSGRALQQNGQPVSDAAERSQLIQQSCDAFFANGLPQLVRLGIVDLDSVV